MDPTIKALRLSSKKMNEIVKTVDNDPLILQLRANAFIDLYRYITYDQECQIRDHQMIHEIDIDLNDMQLRWAYLKGHHNGQLDALHRMHNAAVLADNEIAAIHNRLCDPLIDKALAEEETNHE